MADVMTMFTPSKWLTWPDLKGKEWVLTITGVVAGEVVGTDGKASKKPVLSFKESPKPFAISKTDARTIATLYGRDTAAWTDKQITVFPTTTRFGKDTVECVRVKPAVPK